MSSPEQVVDTILAHLVFAADGAVIGVALAYVAVRSIIRFTSTSRALHRIRKAPSLGVSDLHALCDSLSDTSDKVNDSNERLVVVRGIVEAKSAVEGSWMSLRPNVLVSQESGEKGVILQRSQRCIYNEWRGLFGWTFGIRSLLLRPWKENESTSTRTVPFVLVQGEHLPPTSYVVVNIDGSQHPLPLTTVHHQLHPIKATPYTLLQALFGHEYPVGIVDEEKVLPPGKAITAVGTWSRKNSINHISSCRDIPYFLSEMTKDQIVSMLSFKANVFLWVGIVCGFSSLGVLGYAALRNWKKWREGRQRRDAQRRYEVIDDGEEESDDVPDGSLCIICITRRRRAAFVPCGHRTCCYPCALSMEREMEPKCPVCRQSIEKSIRIYDA